MSARAWPWSVLDLADVPETTGEVRRAYAKKLKTIDQATDIAGFEALRKAYDAALSRVELAKRWSASRSAPVVPTPPAAQVRPAPPPPAPAPAVTLPDFAPDDTVRPLSPPVVTMPDPAPAPAAVPPAPVITLPDPAPIPPASIPLAPPTPPPPSAEAALERRLAGLLDPNIVQSPVARIRDLLEEPQFLSPELNPILRRGLAKYLRNALATTLENETYLPLGSVTPDMLRDLDARFGWLSDFKAFDRDLGRDMRLLQAMIEVAGIKSTRNQTHGLAGSGRKSRPAVPKALLFVVPSLLILLNINIGEKAATAPEGSAIVFLAGFMDILLRVLLFSAAVFMVFAYKASGKRIPRAFATVASLYLGFALVSFLLGRIVALLS